MSHPGDSESSFRTAQRRHCVTSELVFSHLSPAESTGEITEDKQPAGTSALKASELRCCRLFASSLLGVCISTY